MRTLTVVTLCDVYIIAPEVFPLLFPFCLYHNEHIIFKIKKPLKDFSHVHKMHANTKQQTDLDHGNGHLTIRL